MILVLASSLGLLNGKAKEEINPLALDRCNENKENK